MIEACTLRIPSSLRSFIHVSIMSPILISELTNSLDSSLTHPFHQIFIRSLFIHSCTHCSIHTLFLHHLHYSSIYFLSCERLCAPFGVSFRGILEQSYGCQPSVPAVLSLRPTDPPSECSCHSPDIGNHWIPQRSSIRTSNLFQVPCVEI